MYSNSLFFTGTVLHGFTWQLFLLLGIEVCHPFPHWCQAQPQALGYFSTTHCKTVFSFFSGLGMSSSAFPLHRPNNDHNSTLILTDTKKNWFLIGITMLAHYATPQPEIYIQYTKPYGNNCCMNYVSTVTPSYTHNT